jgi:penicillin-binding protein 1A
VKNLFLSQDRTWERKVFEIPLSFLMEYTYPKEKILEMYINSIYYGSGAYGIQAASITYFGKPPKALTLAEASLIAGLPAAPSLYSPFVDLTLAKQRQGIVLAAMVKHGFIGPQQAEDAKKAPLRLMK